MSDYCTDDGTIVSSTLGGKVKPVSEGHETTICQNRAATSDL
jgi:hypothetical protein